MARSAKVYVQDRYAGYLAETDEGYIFGYDHGYLSEPDAVSVSLTMPLNEEPYSSANLFPFFDGLIPEGWLLEVVEKNWKIDAADRFGILLVSCRDCIGDVRIEPEADAE